MRIVWRVWNGLGFVINNCSKFPRFRHSIKTEYKNIFKWHCNLTHWQWKSLKTVTNLINNCTTLLYLYSPGGVCFLLKTSATQILRLCAVACLSVKAARTCRSLESCSTFGAPPPLGATVRDTACGRGGASERDTAGWGRAVCCIIGPTTDLPHSFSSHS